MSKPKSLGRITQTLSRATQTLSRVTQTHRAAVAVQVLDDRQHPQLVEASRHLARVLRREEVKVVGLLPASDDVAVLPAAAQIAAALSDQSGAPVALLDVNARWSAAPFLSAPEPTQGGPLLMTRWLAGDRVALLSLPPKATIGAGLLELSRLLRSGRSMFEQILIDLTGLERLGEHLSAAALCDGLAFVARARLTREADLLRLTHAFPGMPVLGVILTQR